MEVWVGPAIVAAFISGLVSLVLVQLNFREGRRLEQLRRAEMIRDFQIALRAEIRSELENLKRYDLDVLLSEAAVKYEAEEGFFVTVPRVPKQIVFDAIVSQIHILPENVIDPVVLYVRQRQVVESLAEDMRNPEFKDLSRERQLAMLRDYLGMWKAWRDFAARAEAALQSGDRQ